MILLMALIFALMASTIECNCPGYSNNGSTIEYPSGCHLCSGPRGYETCIYQRWIRMPCTIEEICRQTAQCQVNCIS